VRTKDTLSFKLHPKQLVAFRSKATEILYRGPAGGGNPHLMRAAAISGCSLSLSPYQQVAEDDRPVAERGAEMP
jgi:hypothetical protein